MVTVSHLVKKYVDEIPLLHEALGKKLLNYGAVANMLKPRIEKELGRKVKLFAIIMALRRHGEEMTRKYESKNILKIFGKESEINMKSGLCDITALKSNTLFDKLKVINGFVDYGKGDILNVTHGHLEVTIVTNQKHKERILELLEGEKIIHIEEELAQVSLKFPLEYLYTPGILYTITKELYWNNVNLIEIISSLTELNFVVKKEDATMTYSSLEHLVAKAGKAT